MWKATQTRRTDGLFLRGIFVKTLLPKRADDRLERHRKARLELLVRCAEKALEDGRSHFSVPLTVRGAKNRERQVCARTFLLAPEYLP